MMLQFKKLFSIIVCLTLCLNLLNFSYAYAADGFEPVEYEEAVSFIENLGIVQTDFTAYGASEVMTRGEFASLIVQFAGMKEIAEGAHFVQKFSDVDESHTYAEYINFATELGYFSGTSATEFSPDGPVYIDQAIKVVMIMLGYGEYAQSKGDYPSGYIACAGEADILEGVDMNVQHPSSRGNVIVLMYNALFADLMITDDVVSDTVSYKISDSETVLSRYHGIYSGEGVVCSDWISSFNNETEPFGAIVIDDVRFDTANRDLGGYVGKNVRYYYKKNGSGKIMLDMIAENNETVTIIAEDGYSFDEASATYMLKNDKTYKFKLASDFDIVYNGHGISGYADIDYADLLTPANGTLTLIDNDDDRKYDAVILECYEIMIFGSYNSYTETVYDEKDGSYNLLLKSYDDYTVMNTSNAAVAPEDIQPGSILMVYSSADNKNLSIVVCNRSETGVVREISSNGEITLNSNIYQYSASARKDCTLSPGKNYTLFLDKYGDVVYWNEISYANFGYLVKADALGSGLNEKAHALIITATGEFADYPFADKVKIETIYDTKTYTNNEIGDILLNCSRQMYPGAEVDEARMYVSYSLNSSGDITGIKLPYVIGEKSEYDNPPGNYDFFKLDYVISAGAQIGSSLPYSVSNKSLGMSISLDENCSVYHVPVFADNSYDYDEFGVRKISTYGNDDEFNMTASFSGEKNQLEAYSTDSDPRIINTLVKLTSLESGSKVYNGYSNNCLVTNVSRILDENGDSFVALDIIKNGKKLRVYAENESVISVEAMKKITISNALPIISADKKRLQSGDVIKYSETADGYVSAVALMYDNEAEDICYKSTAFTLYDVKYRYTSGYVTGLYNGYAQMKLYDQSTASYTDEVRYVSSYARVYVYDVENETGELGSGSDISIGDRVFVVDNYRTPREIIVYKGGNN